MKCKHCVEICLLCIDGICYWEPNDYDTDIGSAIVEETRLQNLDCEVHLIHGNYR